MSVLSTSESIVTGNDYRYLRYHINVLCLHNFLSGRIAVLLWVENISNWLGLNSSTSAFNAYIYRFSLTEAIKISMQL